MGSNGVAFLGCDGEQVEIDDLHLDLFHQRMVRVESPVQRIIPRTQIDNLHHRARSMGFLHRVNKLQNQSLLSR